MTATVAARRRREEGFSLVELIVIVIILGILAAISIATYLNQRQTAERASAISTLTNTRLAAEAAFADNDGFPADPSVYQSEQGAYDYVDDASTDQRVVSVDAAPDGRWVTFAAAAGDRCFYLRMEQGRDLVRSTSVIGDDVSECHAGDLVVADATGEWG